MLDEAHGLTHTDSCLRHELRTRFVFDKEEQTVLFVFVCLLSFVLSHRRKHICGRSCRQESILYHKSIEACSFNSVFLPQSMLSVLPAALLSFPASCWFYIISAALGRALKRAWGSALTGTRFHLVMMPASLPRSNQQSARKILTNRLGSHRSRSDALPLAQRINRTCLETLATLSCGT